jgi:hypothetical protein
MSRKTNIAWKVVGVLLLSAVLIWQVKIAEDPEIVVRDCDIANHQQVIEKCPYEGNVGPVPDAETAVAKAKELWLEKYGVINGKPYDPTGGRPIMIGYDAKNDCWVVNGTLPKNAFGVVPFAIIQGDGTVLAMGMA